MINSKYMIFLPGGRFTTVDAWYYIKYFDTTMNSFLAGCRFVNAVGNKYLIKYPTFIELGCGRGSYLSGIRHSLSNSSVTMIGIDSCKYILSKAPKWINTYHGDILSYQQIFSRAIILFSPCLLETASNGKAIDYLLRFAINRAKEGIVAFCVHNGPEYIQRFSICVPKSFFIKGKKVSYCTIQNVRGLMTIEWSVRTNSDRVEYSRKYIVRPKPYEYWESYLTRQSRLKRLEVYPDDDEKGYYRKLFVGYF